MTTTTLILDKGPRQYVFRYTPGCEIRVLDRIWRLAEDRDVDLDWLDAAMLSFHVVCQAAGSPVAPVRSPRRTGAYR